MEDPRLYQIALGLVPHVGNITARRLISYAGSAEAVFTEKKRTLDKIPGIGTLTAQRFFNKELLKKAEQELEYLERYGIHYCYYLDDDYPQRLRHCEDSPILFYYKGTKNWQSQKIISIVGTRQNTRYGEQMTESLISDIAERHPEVVVVSGLAFGIDILAHKHAMKNKLQTIAVLGHGIGTIYPASHRKYARYISENGDLLTEFGYHEAPDRKRFVRRNRVIAGLADATIVVESDVKGGSLITADIANSYHRDVFAFPGRVNDQYSSGCNQLLKQNKANLITSVSDLEYIMGWDKRQPRQTRLFRELNEMEQGIIDALQTADQLSVDILARKLDVSISRLSSTLLVMEFDGLVKSLPGKMYVKC
jgi:DNA processing protein